MSCWSTAKCFFVSRLPDINTTIIAWLHIERKDWILDVIVDSSKTIKKKKKAFWHCWWLHNVVQSCCQLFNLYSHLWLAQRMKLKQIKIINVSPHFGGFNFMPRVHYAEGAGGALKIPTLVLSTIKAAWWDWGQDCVSEPSSCTPDVHPHACFLKLFLHLEGILGV